MPQRPQWRAALEGRTQFASGRRGAICHRQQFRRGKPALEASRHFGTLLDLSQIHPSTSSGPIHLRRFGLGAFAITFFVGWPTAFSRKNSEQSCHGSDSPASV